MKPGAVSVFFEVRYGPSPGAMEEAQLRDVGPSLGRRDDELEAVARTAGFAEVEEMDVTAAFRETTAGWLEHSDRLADGLIEVLGEEDFTETTERRRRSLQAIDDGILRRSRYVAIR